MKARLVPAVAAVTLLLAGAEAVAADRNYVTVVMELPGATPFTGVRYEIIDRGPAVSAVHRRELPNYGESLHAMALLTAKEANGVFAALRANGAATLKDNVQEKAPLGAATWRVELLLDGKGHVFRVTDPANQMDRRYARVIDAVRRTVKTHAGELPFRNVFFGQRQLGYLNILSIPAARVFIDGFDTKHDTPLFGYEVKQGEHVVRLKTDDGRYDKSYRVRVGPGGTTRLAVDLR